MDKTVYFTKPEDYYKVMFDEANQVKDVTIIGENLIRVTYW